MMRIALGLALAVVACAEPNDIAVLQVCDAACTCQAPSPFERDACMSECEEDLTGFEVPEACVVCAQEAACSQLEECFDRCFAGPEET